jgi:hypothetical protein
MDVHALISKGGFKIRIGLGHEEKGFGTAEWFATSGGKTYTYWFEENQTVKWWEGSFSLSPSKGAWKITGDVLQMDWASGSVERWDLPLFDQETSGVLTTKEGNTLAVRIVEGD